eukprot:TRINITY_DN249_c0_g1_i1.p1 TRINITY_DN249_c0_g1~~TRINITY_DN249_c0_g1_i1.p1  ORF type:complete len:419 (-),score=49.50 TRINITY_DN249_c0_g1_i1:82-1338(-)
MSECREEVLDEEVLDADAEDDPLLDAQDEKQVVETFTGSKARTVLFVSLTCLSCASAIPFRAYLAGVGYWTNTFSKNAWLMFYLLSSLPVSCALVLQYHLDQKHNVEIGAAVAVKLRILLGTVGAATLLFVAPWGAAESEVAFYGWGPLSSVFCMAIASTVLQLASYLTDEFVVAVRIGESLPSLLILLLVSMSSYSPSASTSSVVEFHVCAAVLVVAGGLTYLLLPMTDSMQLVFKLESIDKSQFASDDPGFWWTCSQIKPELTALLLSRSLYYGSLVVTPFLSSNQEPGVLAQQLVMTSLFADVLGRLACAWGKLTSAFKGKVSMFHWLVIGDVAISAAAMLLLVSIHGRIYRCLMYFVLISLNSFLYAMAGLSALDKVANHSHRPKYVLVCELTSGLVCTLSVFLLVIVLYNSDQ